MAKSHSEIQTRIVSPMHTLWSQASTDLFVLEPVSEERKAEVRCCRVCVYAGALWAPLLRAFSGGVPSSMACVWSWLLWDSMA